MFTGRILEQGTPGLGSWQCHSWTRGPMEVSQGALVSLDLLICKVGVRTAQAPPVLAQAVVRVTYDRVGKALTKAVPPRTCSTHQGCRLP